MTGPALGNLRSQTMTLLRRVLGSWGRRKSLAATKPLRRRRAAIRRLIIEPLEARALLTAVPVGFQETLVTKGVNPAGEDFAPDGRLFVANKQGTVSVVEADGTLAAAP